MRSKCAILLGLTILAAGAALRAAAQSDDAPLPQAQALAAAGKWTDAERAARRHLETQPASADGHALLGFVLFKLKRPKESMAEYVETAKLRDLTASELKMFALSCAELRLFSDAEKWISRSLEMDPRDAKAWEARGHIRFEQQHYADAIQDFERSLQLAPRTVSAETGIGLSNELLSRLDEAAAAYRTAISWSSPGPDEDSGPLHALGRVLLKQNRPGEALPVLRRAVAAGPANAQAHEELAKAYSSLNQFDAARRELEQAVQLAPKAARLHFALGQAYRKAGQVEKAKAELELYEKLVGTRSTPAVDPR
jgi:tetratricopeptide (TPR) repeat protein